VVPHDGEIIMFCLGVALMGVFSGLLGLRKMLRD